MRDAAFGWLALGVVLHLANQVARGRGWCATIRLACPGEQRCRARDAVAAWVAGAGMGGILSARGGDAVRLLLLRRRLPEEGYPVLAGTLVAEAAGETALGIAFLAILLALGLEAVPALGVPAAVWIVPAALVALTGIVLFRSRSRALRRITAGLARGCSALRRPRAYLRSVTPWQLASRLLRAASLACFLVAFGLPATATAIGLVMVAQGGGRLLPLAPASAAATVGRTGRRVPRRHGDARRGRDARRVRGRHEHSAHRGRRRARRGDRGVDVRRLRSFGLGRPARPWTTQRACAGHRHGHPAATASRSRRS